MKKLLFSLSLLLTLLVGGGIGYFAITGPKVQINDRIIDEALSSAISANDHAADLVNQNLSEYRAALLASKQLLKSIWQFPSSFENVVPYYHNSDAPGQTAPPGLSYRASYQTNVSLFTSSFQIAPSAFNSTYVDSYLANENELSDPFSKISPQINDTIYRSVKLTPLWKELYAQFPEINYLSFGSSNGVFTSFPYHPVERTFDHRLTQWYQGALSGVKDVVVVIDRSGSMEGNKLLDVKNATKAVIAGLSGKDRFTVLSFADDVRMYSETLLAPSEIAKEEAFKFVDSIISGGTTDIAAAFQSALTILSEQSSQSRQKVVIFITDGSATTGLTSTDAIVTEVAKDNGLADANLMLYALGKDADYNLLQQISNVTRAYSFQVNSSAELREILPTYQSVLAEKAPNRNVVWSFPSFNPKTFQMVITLSVPIYIDNVLIGVLAVEMELNYLKGFLDSLQSFSSQVNFLMDSGGVTVLHPSFWYLPFGDWEESVVRTPVTKLVDDGPEVTTALSRVESGQDSFATFTSSSGASTILVLNNIGPTGLILGTIVELNDVLPESVVNKVEFIFIDPVMLIPGFATGVIATFVVGLLAPRLVKEVEK